jgi:hypothetical protein
MGHGEGLSSFGSTQGVRRPAAGRRLGQWYGIALREAHGLTPRCTDVRADAAAGSTIEFGELDRAAVGMVNGSGSTAVVHGSG